MKNRMFWGKEDLIKLKKLILDEKHCYSLKDMAVKFFNNRTPFGMKTGIGHLKLNEKEKKIRKNIVAKIRSSQARTASHFDDKTWNKIKKDCESGKYYSRKEIFDKYVKKNEYTIFSFKNALFQKEIKMNQKPTERKHGIWNDEQFDWIRKQAASKQYLSMLDMYRKIVPDDRKKIFNFRSFRNCFIVNCVNFIPKKMYGPFDDIKLMDLKREAESGKYNKIQELYDFMVPDHKQYAFNSFKWLLKCQSINFIPRQKVINGEITYDLPGEPDQDLEDKEYWEWKKHRSGIYINKFLVEGKYSCIINKPLWIATTIFTDNHFGNDGVDYERAELDAEIIANTPNMYVLFGGDFLDNFIKANIMTALVNKTSSPKDEIKLFRHYLSLFGKTPMEISRKIIGAISGNHDRRTKDVAGLDILQNLFNQRKIIYAPNEMRMNLNLNKINYKIAMRHGYKFKSQFNLTHTVKQWLRLGDDDFDVGIITHEHLADIEDFFWHGEYKLAVRTGSYKIADTWAKENGFLQGKPVMPTVAFNPFEKKMQSFKYLEDARDFIMVKNSNIIKDGK